MIEFYMPSRTLLEKAKSIILKNRYDYFAARKEVENKYRLSSTQARDLMFYAFAELGNQIGDEFFAEGMNEVEKLYEEKYHTKY